jgi:hypothetical protein
MSERSDPYLCGRTSSRIPAMELVVPANGPIRLDDRVRRAWPWAQPRRVQQHRSLKGISINAMTKCSELHAIGVI